MSEQKELIKLTGLWSKKDKNGNTFLSGSLGGANIVIFKNTMKKPNSKEPDYNIFLSKKDFKKGDADLSDTFDELGAEVDEGNIPF